MPCSTYNILMYSHDTYGLGHIRRTMAIASHLLGQDVNVLILTGSPIAGRFKFEEGIDFVRIPGMIKKSNTIYVPHSIKVDPCHAIDIRKEIILATARAFDPDLFIVDKVPVGLKGEVLPTLQWFRSHRPQAKIVLGLRDILDDAESTREEWRRKGFAQVLRELYSEIWIYGDRDMYDPVAEYAMPPEIAAKTVFCGYIPRAVPSEKYFRRKGPLPKVVVTTGGGGDGYAVLDNFLRMVEEGGPVDYDPLLVTGPFMGRDPQDELAARARKVGVKLTTFMKRLEQKLAEADLVISMGGYNTVCEILSLRKPSLLIPRDTPRREQLIRAEVMSRRGLVDYIKWDDLEPGLLRRKIDAMLADPEPIRRAVENFSMTGLDVMRSRLAVFRGPR